MAIPDPCTARSARDTAKTCLPYSFCEMVQGIGEETVSLLDERNDPAGEREFACRVHHADKREWGCGMICFSR